MNFIKRRHLIHQMLLAGTWLSLPYFLQAQPIKIAQSETNNKPLSSDEVEMKIIRKKVPRTGEMLPVIGMGTWLTFNVGNNLELRNHRTRILSEFLNQGGKFIDSSPMYGSSEEVLGHALNRLEKKGSDVFEAAKVWTNSTTEGKRQFEQSQKRWGIAKIDLEQVHNLVNWKAHLEMLKELKGSGKIRYIGITTSHGRRHDEIVKLLKNHDLDFVQFTYNISNRKAENRLLPLAEDRNTAVIANRPFGGGQLVKKLKQKPFPEWAKEHGCKSWPELLLKFIVSHPAATIAIPATSQIPHMKENMAACYGRLPDQKARQKMARYVAEL